MASTIPATMKSMQFHSNPIEKNLKLNAQTPLPKTAKSLKNDTALIKVAYSSLNPVDYKILESPVGGLVGANGIPSADYSGVVVSSKLAHLKPGDRVFGMTAHPTFGALAEYAIAPKSGLALAPQGVSLEDLSTVGVTGLTAWQSVAPFVKSGDKVLINGASGGVGTFAVQMAKALGCEVTAVCSTPNVDMVKGLGADEVIDYKSTNLVNTLKQKGVKYDLIFDAVFYDPALYFQAHHYSTKQAKFVNIAAQVSLAFIKTFLAIYLLPGFLGGGQRTFTFVTASANVADYEKIAELLSEGKVKPVIESVLDLEDAAKGYARLKSNRTRGKIVIKINGE